MPSTSPSSETLWKHTNCGDRVYACTYDLQKATQSSIGSISFIAGINGKAWRLARTWYERTKCCVRTGGLTSEYFSVSRGIRQGSVLSLILLLLVINPLLQFLSQSDISGLSVGSSAHADGIQVMTNSQQKLRDRIKAVNEFTMLNGLHLNVQKCEILVTGRNDPPDTVNVDEW